MRLYFACLLVFIFANCSNRMAYNSDGLQLLSITPRTWIHVSYLQTDEWGKVACNGLVYIYQGDAIIFDTPTDSTVSAELIHWVEQKKKARVKALVINHFHHDCLGGIEAFAARNIPSYANSKTIAFAKEAGEVILPTHAFSDSIILDLRGQTVVNRFFGEAHTKDNIVSYLPTERVLFGGCQVKALGAGKGYLGDANTDAWSETIRKVKQAYPDVQIVVPGHGAHGGVDLLDFTESLFELKK